MYRWWNCKKAHKGDIFEDWKIGVQWRIGKLRALEHLKYWIHQEVPNQWRKYIKIKIYFNIPGTFKEKY